MHTTKTTFLLLPFVLTACGGAEDAAEPTLRIPPPHTHFADPPQGSADDLGPQRAQGGGKADQIAGIESPGAIDGYNDPSLMAADYVRVLADLPTWGEATPTPWTDTYWPKHKGGFWWRWQTDGPRDYVPPTAEEAAAMTPEEISLLSPSEKYDLFVGSHDYPLTTRSQSEGSATTPEWQGLCHGWTPAAIHFDEPKPVTLTSASGLEIPFGSSDVKALLTYFQGEVVRTRTSSYEHPFRKEVRFLGSLCGSGKAWDSGCFDSNPGAFHIVMANQLGLRGEAFGIDAEPTAEKWNQPVHRFTAALGDRRPPSPGAADTAVEEVVVTAEVTWTQEIHPKWEAVGGTSEHNDTTRRLDYTLELDADGEIVGGQWLLVLQDGHTMTFHQVFDYLVKLDENGDGTPDLTRSQASAAIWQYFEFPDYVWTMDKGEFGTEFKPASSAYTLLATTNSTRHDQYGYFAKLGELYEASTR